MPTVKITGQTEDGTETTVLVDDESLPDGLLSAETVRASHVTKDAYDHLKDEIEKRIGKARRKAFEDRMSSLSDAEDDDVQEVVERFRDTVGADRLRSFLGVKAGASDEERAAEAERLTAQVRKREVDPLTEQISSLTSTVDLLRGEQFRAEFRKAAADADVEPEMTEYLEDYYERRVVFDAERGRWWIKGEDGEPEISTTKKEDGSPPFRTLAEDLSDLKASGERGALFRSTVRDGAGFRGSDRRGGGGGSKKAGEMNSAEKAAFIGEHGLDKWKEHVAAG